jgi:Tol biopolymer transport system component/tRNA A-37 threonylcarbamoyl transferase component Bud32
MTEITDRLQSALAGRYSIEREIGAGGMATVYLAHDVRHDRKVAVKVLRPELAAVIGAERFLTEIKTTANLQHPHILPLHDSGEADSFLFYVMPFVEGDTLRDRLEHEKQLPVTDAVRIATEVADALDYAHRQDVIHRDIKPENILLHDGRAMVADFGIALAVTEAGGTRMTETGMSLGTPHYMSPEQAMGERDITAKSDVYALGCVLYEMLTGEPPFTGPTAQAVVARVMTEAPRPVSVQRHTVEPHVEAALEQALEKLPADRFANAADFAAALRHGTGVTRSSSHHRGAPATATTPRRLTVVLGSVAVVALALAAWGWLQTPVEVSPTPVRFSTTIPAHASVRTLGWRSALAISPDGRSLVFVGRAEQESQLYRRDLADLSVEAIPHTEGALGPFFSPDGRWVAFRNGNLLQKVDMHGGRAITITALEGSVVISGATWSSSDTIYYGHEISRGLFKVAGSGQGDPIEVFPTGNDDFLWWPSMLPGDRWLLATLVSTATSVSSVVAVSIATGEVRPLVENASWARYLDDGFMVVRLMSGAVMLMPIDVSDPRVTGPQVAIRDDLSATSGRAPQLAWAANGTAFFLPGGSEQHTIVLVDREGRETNLIDEIGPYRNPRWSPDGERLAFRLGIAGSEEEEGDLWIYHLPTETLSRLTFESDNLYPVWSRDGSRIVFTSRRDGIAGLWWKASDATGQAERLIEGNDVRFPGSVTPDDRTLLYREIAGGGSGFDIYGVSLVGDRVPDSVLVTQFDEGSPMISPDGSWLAYTSNESGRNEVYLRRYPDGGARWRVSQEGGTEPMWHPQGRELFYRGGTTLWSARLQLGQTAVVTRRDSLFDGSFYTNIRWPEYDVTPDGDHFVMIKMTGQAREPVVALGWVQEVIRQAQEQLADD